jgi:hypothetical protein
MYVTVDLGPEVVNAIYVKRICYFLCAAVPM